MLYQIFEDILRIQSQGFKTKKKKRKRNTNRHTYAIRFVPDRQDWQQADALVHHKSHRHNA